MPNATPQSTAARLIQWADRLRDITAMALIFCENFHDREAFTAAQTIAMEMEAAAAGVPPAEIEPLRGTVFSQPTPLSTVDAAIIDAAGRILLIRRADSRRWALPGGALMVGETAAAGAAREALEETGVSCRAVALVGVFDSHNTGSSNPRHILHFCFLCEPLNGGAAQPASHALEILEQAWFTEAELPVDMHHGAMARAQEAFRVWRGDPRAFFDG